MSAATFTRVGSGRNHFDAKVGGKIIARVWRTRDGWSATSTSDGVHEGELTVTDARTRALAVRFIARALTGENLDGIVSRTSS